MITIEFAEAMRLLNVFRADDHRTQGSCGDLKRHICDSSSEPSGEKARKVSCLRRLPQSRTTSVLQQNCLQHISQ